MEKEAVRSTILQLQRLLDKCMQGDPDNLGAAVSSVYAAHASFVEQEEERTKELKASYNEAGSGQSCEGFQRCPSCGGLFGVVLRKYD